jgi:hypothetical protein
MTIEHLQASYAPFVTTLRHSEFDVPNDGWSEELITAHIIANNDLIAKVAERIGAGESPGYDNEAAVDETALRLLVDAAGGISGLADAVERSATRLAVAQGNLTDDTSRIEVDVMIHSDGAIVVDQRVPIGELIAGNASFHLESHYESLVALKTAVE